MAVGDEFHLADAEAFAVAPDRIPAGEAARGFKDIRLGVATVDAEGVEFHQLARIIFVGFALVGIFAAIEVKEHGGAEGRFPEHGGKISQGMSSDDGAVIEGFEPGAVGLRGVDVEMIRPEGHHHFIQLVRRADRPKQRGPGEIEIEFPGMVVVKLAGLVEDGFMEIQPEHLARKFG